MKGKILVVDDEPDVLNLARIILEKAGFHVVTASDGLECERRILDERPDLLLLDEIMPRKNGVEVCRTLKGKTITQHIPIIIFSASGSNDRKKAALQAGADDFLAKPFTIKELTDIMLKHCSQNGKLSNQDFVKRGTLNNEPDNGGD